MIVGVISSSVPHDDDGKQQQLGGFTGLNIVDTVTASNDENVNETSVITDLKTISLPKPKKKSTGG